MEIADSVIEPHIIQQEINKGESFFIIKINGILYIITINLIYHFRGYVDIKIDYSVDDGSCFTSMKTNEGKPLFVLAHIIGVIKYFLSLDRFKNITLSGILIKAKSEVEGDTRRHNIYEYYLKTFKNMGIEILSEEDITKKSRRKSSDKLSSYKIKNPIMNILPKNESPNIFTKYNIKPIRIGDLKIK